MEEKKRGEIWGGFIFFRSQSTPHNEQWNAADAKTKSQFKIRIIYLHTRAESFYSSIVGFWLDIPSLTRTVGYGAE